mmetsp:Transcript_30344/g.49034  ORF Transcript_30344/g.49034 Transcript_30344/m.49034 type:complete len:83 (-) Transcript_30344:486-734(-)
MSIISNHTVTIRQIAPPPPLIHTHRTIIRTASHTTNLQVAKRYRPIAPPAAHPVPTTDTTTPTITIITVTLHLEKDRPVILT